MCGIVAIFNIKEQSKALRDKALRMSAKIRHRGPDWSGIYCGKSAILRTNASRSWTRKAAGNPCSHPTGNRFWP